MTTLRLYGGFVPTFLGMKMSSSFHPPGSKYSCYILSEVGAFEYYFTQF